MNGDSNKIYGHFSVKLNSFEERFIMKYFFHLNVFNTDIYTDGYLCLFETTKDISNFLFCRVVLSSLEHRSFIWITSGEIIVIQPILSNVNSTQSLCKFFVDCLISSFEFYSSCLIIINIDGVFLHSFQSLNCVHAGTVVFFKSLLLTLSVSFAVPIGYKKVNITKVIFTRWLCSNTSMDART